MRRDSRTWIWVLIFSALGALLNRIRGGGWNDLSGKKLWYPLFLGSIGLFFGLPWWSVLVLAPLWYLGQQIYGWGSYFGCAIYGVEGDIDEDCKWINKLCWKWEEADRHFLYGITTLWCRGIVWNLPPVLGLQFLLGGRWDQLVFTFITPMLFGLGTYCMGRLFGCGTGEGQDCSKTAWNWSEVLWGFIQTAGWIGLFIGKEIG